MTRTFETPGVYYQRVDAEDAAVAPLRMDIAAFIGLAARGPLDTPVPVQSWRQFESYFGSFTGYGYLAYAVRGFFENGGSRCWVVRVASNDPVAGAAAAGIELRAAPQPGQIGPPIWRIRANSPGVWGSRLTVQVAEVYPRQTLSRLGLFMPNATPVQSTAGFAVGTLVRLFQPGRVAIRIVVEVDPVDNLLYWVHRDPLQRRPFEAQVQGFDPNLPILLESVAYTITVREDRRPVAVYGNLSLVPHHPDYACRRLRPVRFPQENGIAPPLPDSLPPIVVEELRELPLPGPLDPPHHVLPPATVLDQTGGVIPPEWELAPTRLFNLRDGRDGLRMLKTFDFTGAPSGDADSEAVRRANRRGLQTLDFVDEVSAVAIPDIHIQPLPVAVVQPPPECIPDPCLPNQPPPKPPRPPAIVPDLPPIFTDEQICRVQAALVDDCDRRRDRIALLDPPLSLTTETGAQALLAWRSRFDSMFATLYYPWLLVVDPVQAGRGDLRAIPPSGHVAGQYARSEAEVGVHRAPANRPLDWVQALSTSATPEQHGLWNQIGINLIREQPGLGRRILGARTLSSDPDWRYVNVRRLLILIEKAVYLSLQWAVFEPNNEFTWAKIRLVLTSYLLSLWQQGALAGNAAEEAFWVRCDAVNNDAAARNAGRLLAEIGVAPVKPFEFIVLRVGRVRETWEIAAAAGFQGGR
jgi:uncharacterized protein